jgi:DNA-binding CsgD family transcriptional regulator
MSAAPGAIASRPPAELVPALVRLADALAWPLLLVDDQGVLHHANDSGRNLLTAGQPLRLDGHRRLQPASPSYRADFWVALRAAAAGKVCELRWPGAPGGRTATLRPLAPLPAGSALLLLELKPAFHAAPVRRPDVTAYAQAHGLSAAQTQLLLALAEGRRVSQLAADLKLPPSTVRSRLVAVRRKTGHGHVDELLRTLWSLPPALDRVADGK